MSITQVIWRYLFFYATAFVIGLILTKVLDENYFAEIGATIIIYAIWRGTRSLRKSSISGFEAFTKGAQKRALKWDITAGIIGTAVNGYSNQIFWLIKQLPLPF